MKIMLLLVISEGLLDEWSDILLDDELFEMVMDGSVKVSSPVNKFYYVFIR